MSGSVPLTQDFCGRRLLVLLLGGVIFLTLFYLRYSQIPDQFYALRDDGVITLSHGRNWVDYGFIGVSPSGGRVEAFSAPLQFLMSVVRFFETDSGRIGGRIWRIC
jgi:hypothetical protein